MRSVAIFDTTLRDAEQIPGGHLNADQKVEVARQLARLGVNAIEAGFPFSSPGDLAAVRRVASEVTGPTIVGLARCLPRDIEHAWEAVKPAEKKRIHTFIGMSDIHIERITRNNREQVLQKALDSIALARDKCDEVEFTPMDTTRMEYSFLCDVVGKAIERGASIINIADTVGRADPSEIYAMVSSLLRDVSGAREVCFSIHCHDDLGMATANSIAAVRAGVGQVECCVNGFGERAGNAALEEVVVALATRDELYGCSTSINLKEIRRTSKLVSTMMGMPVQHNKAVVGRNAFAHSSGIHQDGMLKDKLTFEIINPALLGIEEHKLVLTARSGRKALVHRLKELGYAPDDAKVDWLYDKFIEIADRKLEVVDDDLHALMADQLAYVPESIELVALEAFSTTPGTPQAKVTLSVNGEERSASSSGDGPIDALFQAVNSITGLPAQIDSYDVHAVSRGKDAVGEVNIRASLEGRQILGRASGTDVVATSVRAYLQVVNQLLR